MLLVLFQKGGLWLIDPFTAEVKKTAVVGLLETEILIKGKTFDNGFAV